jgi:L-fuconolactonase
MTPVVDAHLHIWDAGRADYSWLGETPELPPVAGLDDARPEQDAVGVSDVVLVQAADHLADTELMLEVASRDPRVVGVVAWAPLTDPASVEALLDTWRGLPVVGLRHLVHRDPDPDLLVGEQVQVTLGLLGRRNLTFDVCAETPHLLSLVPGLAERHGGTTFVIDHLGKPPIGDRGWQPWADLLAAAAAQPNVAVKLSGLNTAAGPRWTGDDFVPYVDHALDCFGPERMMIGGDWPFARLNATSYTQVWEGLRLTLDALSPGELEQVLGGTARRVYRLGDGQRPSQPPSTGTMALET